MNISIITEDSDQAKPCLVDRKLHPDQYSIGLNQICFILNCFEGFENSSSVFTFAVTTAQTQTIFLLIVSNM